MELASHVKLFEHQKESVIYTLKSDYVILALEMGLGKTLSSIAVSVAMKSRTLVVCPAFLKYNWMQEYKKFTNLDSKSILVISKPRQLKSIPKEVKVVIVNYERLNHWERIVEWKPQLVISDEAHFLKNMKAQRTSHFHNMIIRSKPERLMLMTGTPVKNKVPDFYSLLLLCSYCPSKANGKSIRDKYKSEYSFSKHFTNEKVFSFNKGGRRVEVRKFEGVKNPQELKSYFRGKYLRRLTKQVIDLPEIRHKEVFANYDYDDSDLKEILEKHQSKMDGHIMKVKSGSAVAKAPFTAEYAKEMHNESESPIVIFTDHIEPVKIIYNYLKKYKKKVEAITGATPVEERQRIVNRFQEGKTDFIVATIGAASTGITLTRARDLIFNDLNYVPAENEQASKRIHRIGQKNSCLIHIITGSYVDSLINKNLLSIQTTINQIVE